MRISVITHEMVDLAPAVLRPGVLYISGKYGSAVHLCCCGCGEKVVTPLSRAEWRVSIQRGRVSVEPSIGNWGMSCQSHYWIRNGQVIWAGRLSAASIREVHERDQRALQVMHRQAADRAANGLWARVLARLRRWLG